MACNYSLIATHAFPNRKQFPSEYGSIILEDHLILHLGLICKHTRDHSRYTVITNQYGYGDITLVAAMVYSSMVTGPRCLENGGQ